MRDPFGAQQHVHVVHQSSGGFTPVTMPSRTGYMFGNGDGESWAPTSSSLIRHQYPKMSGIRNVRDEFNNSLLDPEIEKELCSRSRSQEEEILLLRQQISDASVQELQLLQEKHVLERRLSDLRMALDEKQNDATSDALKELTQRKGYIEENIRLAYDLKVAEEEVYVFTSSLLSLLAEYNIRLPLLNSSTITNNTKRLHQHMDWKIRSSGASFGEIKHKIGNRPGDMTSTIDRHPPKVSNNQLSQQQLDSRMSDLQQHKQYHPVEFNVEPSSSQSRVDQNYDLMYMKGVKNAPNSDLQYKEFPSTIYKEVGGTITPNLREEATFEARTRRETADVQYERRASPGSDDDLTSPGIEGFQIIGEAKPGCTLRACGFPTNGTSLCIFQWVRHLENGTRQSIEGATVPDYVVTADDVDTFLAVDCIPMDDNGHQGELVSLFANNQNKITCDPDMQHAIGSHISSGRAIFLVFLLMESSETWEETSLILKRSGYQVIVNSTQHAMIEEKYSPDIYIKVPYGQSTQFVLICSDGTTLPFSTSGASQAYNTDDDIRLRDVIVLTMRYFQSKAVDGKRKGRA
ncbi:uncharacterized protein M6B38_353115 [Iris pallida]|uniref:Uncharacterized protein n=1 Tax=Iris pallida TaxID=29817 RepID=A0AAX6GPY0_IRIPA|nr:uncharacterized protein M6B38_353115 [Iris pallida]